MSTSGCGLSRPDHRSDVKNLLLLGVSGGIAAYKTVEVASRFRKAGFDVHVVLSEAATQFIAPRTFSAVTGNPALTDLFPPSAQSIGEAAYPHLYPATRADLFLLAPATADMIAKLAHGFGSDLLSTCALSLPQGCLKYFAPAMNTEMWNQPVVQQNVRTLEGLGWVKLGPEEGLLACGAEGPGRMMEPALLVEQIRKQVPGNQAARPLRHRRVLVLSGPTREQLDPVRFLSNPSSGKMGQALAEAAVAMGATVDFVTGPVPEQHLPRLDGVTLHAVNSADEMLATSAPIAAEADLFVFAAAVADYRPAHVADQKLPKTTEPFSLELVPTPDIAATLSQQKRPGQLAVGFALQTEDGIPKAQAKLQRKHLDGILLNSPEALGGSQGTYTWISGPRGEQVVEWGTLSKRACADQLLTWAAERLDVTVSDH